MNEKQIARLFGLALGSLLTAGLVLSAMASSPRAGPSSHQAACKFLLSRAGPTDGELESRYTFSSGSLSASASRIFGSTLAHIQS